MKHLIFFRGGRVHKILTESQIPNKYEFPMFDANHLCEWKEESADLEIYLNKKEIYSLVQVAKTVNGEEYGFYQFEKESEQK